MTTDTDRINDVYGAKSPEQSREVYNQWSATYDADNLAKGFRLPSLGAGYLARFLGRETGPLLDAGCGTGLVGESLMVMGYDDVTGCDMSPGMIALARKTGAYRGFEQADMGAALPFDTGQFAGFTCIGSFGPGHAPPSTLTHLARVTRPGGYGVFNLIESTYQDQGFAQVMDQLSRDGIWEIVEKSEPFLPFLLGEDTLFTRLFAVRIL